MRLRPEQESGRPPRQSVPLREHHADEDLTIPEAVTKPWTLPPQRPYVFEDINVIDAAAGKVLPNRTVHIARGKIVSIRASSAALPTVSAGPDDDDDDDDDEAHQATHIRCTGKYLCPGLIDAHVHLASVPGEPDLRTAMAIPETVSLLRQPHQAAAMLSRGITTARDCGGATLALQAAIADGVVAGPRLFTAGRALSQTGGHGDSRGAYDSSSSSSCPCAGHGLLSRVVDGAPAVLAAARDELRRGADFVKIMAGGGVASPTDRLRGVQFTADEVRAAADAAAARETYVTAHAYTPAAIRRAVEGGARGVEHGNFLDRETAALLAARGVFLTPTLVTYRAMADPRYAAFLPAGNREKNEMVLREGLRSVRLAHEAGVTMCLGTDLLSFLGVEQLGEFGLRAQVLPGEEVLKHATVNPARMLGQEEVLGQVREGFVADLLVLNANPLEEITILERPERHLLAVVKEGRVYNSRWSKMPVDVYSSPELIE